ncbi:DNA-directed RNA polymerase I subunit RPA14 [Hanseniaspora osmophila]|uniref:DNA-directed RNA polymerase I subunit RPA14 n=1 Tax=Hanseniaspora osmophila TaxID=56408 RepID=A0A1E5R7W6_9ASCO|nr:DNA-directed RNA polymerase I subunit RPA14 [Hanseniaspora osmophila]
MYRSRRMDIGANPLATPIVIHKTAAPRHIDEQEVLQFISNFVATREDELNSINSITLGGGTSGVSETGTQVNQSANASQYISQLKRIERDFKGLPPTIYNPTPADSIETVSVEEPEVVETETGTELVSKSVTGGTKKTFA